MIDAGNDALRLPKDFCYVTSMNKGETNLSPFIIALGILNLGVFTIWFPVKLRKLVNRNIYRFSFAGNEDDSKNPHKFLYDGTLFQ